MTTNYPRRYRRPAKPSIIDEQFKKDLDWRREAACAKADTQIFFPNANAITRANRHEVERAFTLCESCPVAGYCMYEALIYDYDGIWARSLPRQRNSFIKHYFPTSLDTLTPQDAYLFYRELCGKIVDPTRRYAKRTKRIALASSSDPQEVNDTSSTQDGNNDV